MTEAKERVGGKAEYPDAGREQWKLAYIAETKEGVGGKAEYPDVG